MKQKLIGNFPILSRFFKKQSPITLSNIPEVTEITLNQSDIAIAPEPTYLQDCVLFPFSDKISLLLQSLGAEIVEKMQHSVSGADFLLLKLPDTISVENARRPREGEFTGTMVGDVAKMLFTADKRLLAFVDGLNGDVTVSVGSTWDEIADLINSLGTKIEIPNEVIELGRSETALSRSLELLLGGCAQQGLISYRYKAQEEFESKRKNNTPEALEQTMTFEEFLEPLKRSIEDISEKRSTIMKSIIASLQETRNTQPRTLA